MRYLVLMRGAPGSGKSTWIRENNLSSYALSADVIRLQMQSPQLNPDGTFSISQRNDDRVWNYLFSCLEDRMERGEFTIIDATHSRVDLISRYKKLVEKYRYRVVVLEILVPLEELLSRNAQRPMLDRVPEEVIRNAFARIKTQKAHKWTTVINQDQFWDTFSIKPIDSSAFSRVVHIGDIHGCYEPLAKVLKDIRDTDLVIFLGDYFDRGIQNVKVFETLLPLMQRRNFVFLQGNHEKGLYQWAFDEDFLKRGFRNTATQFEEAGIAKEDARQFYRKLSQASYYTWRSSKVLVSHGAIPIEPSYFISSDNYINGTGKYEALPDVYDSWRRNTSDIVQVHGHRNAQSYPIINDRIINLCGTPEFGGSLRVAILSESGWEAREYPNSVFNTRLHQDNPIREVPSNSELVAQLRANKNIRESHQFGDVSSFNYTSKAFWDRKWDSDTVRARGLYIRVSDGTVVARGYKKFFAVGEHSSCSKGELKKNLKFPVTVSIKYNGYLGIVGYDNATDTVIVGTKGGVHNDYALKFREMLPDAALDYVKHHNVSLTFEVIDPEFDPHIIKYDSSRIVLLDIIDNQVEFSKRPLHEIKELAAYLNVECREVVRVFENWESIHDFLEEQDEYRDNDVEGYVLEDKNLYMFRVKTRYYRFWKYMRSVMNTIKAGRQVSLSQLYSEKHNYVYAEMLKRKDDLTDIIAFRDSI